MRVKRGVECVLPTRTAYRSRHRRIVRMPRAFRPWYTVAVVIVTLAVLIYAMTRLARGPKARWVDEAVATVERDLRAGRVASLPQQFGPFQQLDGRGYEGAAFNINAPHVIARRTGHFDSGQILILIYVWEPDTSSSAGAWSIERVETDEYWAGQIRIYVRRK